MLLGLLSAAFIGGGLIKDQIEQNYHDVELTNTFTAEKRDLACEESINNLKATYKGEVEAICNEYIPPKTYSSNNNLSNLQIDGYSLSPEFSNSVKEYSVEVPNGTEKVVINATKEDSTASVSGIGEVDVNEGVNKIELKVTAENGNVNTYIIKK